MKEQHKISFVSRNQGKIREARFILEKFGIGVESVELEKVEIQSDKPEEIASASARTLLSQLADPFIVEDAGLFVPALSGFPGPYSHYVLGTVGCEGVLRLLGSSSQRDAYFASAAAYADRSGEVRTFVGKVDGTISHEVRGREGFGFDPIFIPAGKTKTFGELSLEEKSEISHRRRSLEAFANWYRRRDLMAPQS